MRWQLQLKGTTESGNWLAGPMQMNGKPLLFDTKEEAESYLVGMSVAGVPAADALEVGPEKNVEMSGGPWFSVVLEE